MTDIHLQPENNGILIFNKAIHRANLLKPNFVVTGGDNIRDAMGQIGYIDSLQIRWLKNDLGQLNKNTPIVIVSHIPLLSVERLVLVGFEDGIPNTCLVTNARAVIEILQQYNVKMVLQGHSHFREDILYNGIHFISGGAVNGINWNEKLPKGFLKIDISDEDFEYKYVEFEEDI